MDGVIDFSDFLRLAAHFAQTGSWEHGDFDDDQFIGFADFLLMSANFGSVNAAVSVPEPAQPVTAILLMTVLARRTRRHRRTKSAQE